MTHTIRSAAGLACGLAVLLACGNAFSQESPPPVPGTVEGVGARFEITDSDYLNVLVETADMVSVRLASIPEMILLDIGPAGGATSTQVTISGLPPLATMHRYLDSFANHVPIAIDETGRVTWVQDLAQWHLVIIQPRQSTIYLDTNGWSDPTVGTWDSATLTGTLTQDVTETIEVRAGVTLDGADHSVTAVKGTGVSISEYDKFQPGVTVQNLLVRSTGVGILARTQHHITISHNTIEVARGGYGMDISEGPHRQIRDNSVRGYSGPPYKEGIKLFGCSGSCESNTVADADLAFSLYKCSTDTLKYNTIFGPGSCFALRDCNNVLLFNNHSIATAPPWVDSGSGNRFQLDPPIGGNYWSAWTSPDKNGDGFVDKEYGFLGGKDSYPLTTPEPRYFQITAEASSGGSIAPSGTVQVLPGTDQRFEFMPEVCFLATNLYVDGLPQKKPFEWTYNFVNVWASHSIQVGFAEGNRIPSVTITAPPSGAIFPVGEPVPLTGNFDDRESPTQTHTAQWLCDGLSVSGVVDEDRGTVSADYTFTVAGVYLVSLTVTDQCGDSATTNTIGGLDAMVVVYDPNAGFVTGGGWISSPLGAYAPDPALAGKANFGFVSKYQKGKSVPTGETEFQFKVADLNFHSASYDWLVISGSKAQYKGRGTINGAGDYGFMLTATDGDLRGRGQADMIRIKITDRISGALVYDNQMGAVDETDPTTALGGGSIVIHTTGGGTAPAAALASPSVSEASVPAVYGLFQNQPNPFAASTEIGFDLPEAGRVRLTLYNVAGRLVETLVDEERPAGRHEVVWSGDSAEGSRMGAGVYFYRITVQPVTGGAAFTSIKRLILLR